MPTTNASRALPLRGIVGIHVSPNREYAAFALRDGRIALVDFAALQASMKQGGMLPKVAIPTSCSDRDPFDLRDPSEQGDDPTEDIEGHDDELEGDDGEDTGD